MALLSACRDLFERGKKRYHHTVALIIIVGLAPNIAFASNDGGEKLTRVIDNIVGLLSGGLARSLATLAFVGTGLAWMTNNLNTKKALSIGMGIGLVVGAAQIVKAIWVT